MNPLLLLHGAIGSASQLQPLKSQLDKFQTFDFDFPGHGGKPFPDETFSIKLFAESVLQFLDDRKIPQTDIFGYSMGGYVAFYLAKHFPERVGKIMTLATKLDWNIPTAEKEVKMLDPEKIRAKVPAFAAALEKRHAPQAWEENLKRTAAMMLDLGKQPELTDEDFASIAKPVLLSVGDRDTMVTLEETIHVYRKIPGAQLAVIPSTPHPLEQVDLGRIVPVIDRFFTR